VNRALGFLPRYVYDDGRSSVSGRYWLLFRQEFSRSGFNSRLVVPVQMVDLATRACRPQNLTPFDTNWKKGSGATPLTTQDL
jgi:hypothetical protein